MLLDKLKFIENKYDELSVKISDPSIMQNQNEWRKLCKEHADLESILNANKENRHLDTVVYKWYFIYNWVLYAVRTGLVSDNSEYYLDIYGNWKLYYLE